MEVFMVEARILNEYRVIAVVGASTNPERASYQVVGYLMEHGYRVYPVNPNAREILGRLSYPDLGSIAEKVEVVDIFRRSEEVMPIVEEAIRIGAKAVWMQKSIINEEAEAKARDAGLLVVMDKCIREEHQRLVEAGDVVEKEKMTLEKVLRKAIQKEIASWLLYRDLSRRVTQETAREAFKKLAEQEKGHRQLLEQYQRGEIKEGALSQTQAVDYKISEHLEQPRIYPDMDFKDIFLLAAGREKASHELYLGLAEIHPLGRVRKLLEELAAQELEHKQQLELLYTEVAFPQTDGG
jgi:predicted CoA-binding protein/rubrerythrin